MIFSTFIYVLVSITVKSVYGNFRLQILHCNDLHARFAETDTYGAPCPNEFVKIGKCFGGFARLKQAAIEATEEAKKQNIPTVFLNAGDTFQGSPFYSIYKWKICAELVAKIGFDVMTIGNHEFDDGIENLVNFLKNANTPTVCSNLNLDSEPKLKISALTSSYVMTVNNKKIGFIGYLTPDTKHLSNSERLEIYPEIPYIKAEAERLKAAGVNIIIALGHSGIKQDMIIAKELEDISLIVGGHSHTLLYTPPDNPPSTESTKYSYPTWVTQKSGKKVPIVQAYANSKYLGKLDIEFDDLGNVVSATGNPVLLDGTKKKDPNMSEAVSMWTKNLMEKLRTVKGYTRTFLGKPNFFKGIFECTLGNFITDALIDLGVKYSAKNNIATWTIGPIALYQNGGMRREIDNRKNEGALTLEDVMEITPFGNKIKLVTLRGTTIRKILEFNLQTYTPKHRDISHHYVHFSGMKVVYDLSQPAGNRVKSVEVICTQCDTPKFVSLEDGSTYQVLMVSFLADGGDSFEMIPKEMLNSTTLEWNDFECLTMYVEKHTFIYPKIDNRVIVEEFQNDKKSPTSFANTVKVPNLCLICIFLAYLVRNW